MQGNSDALILSVPVIQSCSNIDGQVEHICFTFVLHAQPPLPIKIRVANVGGRNKISMIGGIGERVARGEEEIPSLHFVVYHTHVVCLVLLLEGVTV